MNFEQPAYYKETLHLEPAEVSAWLESKARAGIRLSRRLVRWLALDPLWVRQDGKCAACHHDLGAIGTFDVDHLTPRCKGGADTLDNLQLLCAVCHRIKTPSDLSGRRLKR